MPYSYALAEHGTTLATRPLGRELRLDLIARVNDANLVELDFGDILATSHSFADEFVAALAQESERGEVGFDLVLIGASGDVERVIRRALDRRGAAIRQPA